MHVDLKNCTEINLSFYSIFPFLEFSHIAVNIVFNVPRYVTVISLMVFSVSSVLHLDCHLY